MDTGSVRKFQMGSVRWQEDGTPVHEKNHGAGLLCCSGRMSEDRFLCAPFQLAVFGLRVLTPARSEPEIYAVVSRATSLLKVHFQVGRIFFFPVKFFTLREEWVCLFCSLSQPGHWKENRLNIESGKLSSCKGLVLCQGVCREFCKSLPSEPSE